MSWDNCINKWEGHMWDGSRTLQHHIRRTTFSPGVNLLPLCCGMAKTNKLEGLSIMPRSKIWTGRTTAYGKKYHTWQWLLWSMCGKKSQRDVLPNWLKRWMEWQSQRGDGVDRLTRSCKHVPSRWGHCVIQQLGTDKQRANHMQWTAWNALVGRK